MASHSCKIFLAFVILFSVCQATLAGSRNGIRMWRDRSGVLNISNVGSSGVKTTHIGNTHTLPPKKYLIPASSPKGEKPKVTSASELNAVSTRSSSVFTAPTRHSIYTNIYTYTDSLGVKHFTNIPTGSQRYQLALRTHFIGLSPDLTTHRSAYDRIVVDASRAYQVDQALVRAMIHAESAFNPMAISPKGAVGLMQLMPDTANRYGVRDSFDPSDNVHGGVHYLRDLLDMFDNNLTLAIAAYNAGENAVTRYGGVPPYAETTRYVQKVLSLHNRYQNQTGTINN